MSDEDQDGGWRKWDQLAQRANAWATGKAADAAGAVQEKATEAGQAAALAALGKALDALDHAVRAVKDRGPAYEITLEISAGPVSLSVTIPRSEGDGGP